MDKYEIIKKINKNITSIDFENAELEIIVDRKFCYSENNSSPIFDFSYLRQNDIIDFVNMCNDFVLKKTKERIEIRQNENKVLEAELKKILDK